MGVVDFARSRWSWWIAVFQLIDLLHWEWRRGGSYSELVGLMDAGLLRIFMVSVVKANRTCGRVSC